jgi:hypothetical protein
MFYKTLNFWDQAFADKVISGEVRLNTGQWVQCGNGHKSRFIGVTRGNTVNVAHYPNTTGKAFKTRSNAFKKGTL